MANNQTTPTVGTTTKPSIILIHGLWMTPLSWKDWISYYESLGYQVLAPGWPGVDDRTVEEIRKDPTPMNGVSIGAICDNYERIIRTLPTPPIIMGHSFGGLFVQILLSRGLGAAGVSICPGTPAGIFALPLTTIKSTFNVLSKLLKRNETVPLGEKDFHYAFGNHLSAEESKVLWDEYSIPANAHVLWQGALVGVQKESDAKVDFAKVGRAPLLLVAGTNDHVAPQSVIEKEKATYTGTSVVELKIFEGRTHGIVNQDGWKDVADFGLKWVEKELAL